MKKIVYLVKTCIFIITASILYGSVIVIPALLKKILKHTKARVPNDKFASNNPEPHYQIAAGNILHDIKKRYRDENQFDLALLCLLLKLYMNPKTASIATKFEIYPFF